MCFGVSPQVAEWAKCASGLPVLGLPMAFVDELVRLLQETIPGKT